MALYDTGTTQKLASLESIIICSRKKHFHILHGEHQSAHMGSGMEFREVRDYSSEDDTRHINWKVTARTGTPSINVYNETKQIPIVLVYLNSGGLYFGESKSKHHTAVEVMTSLSYAAISNHDATAAIFFSSAHQQWYAPGKQKSTVARNYSAASELKPLGNSICFSSLSKYIMKKLKRKSIIFLIGDFWDLDNVKDLDEMAYHHELYCTIIRDHAEESISLRGTLNITNTKTETSHKLNIDKQGALRYEKLVTEHDHMLQKYFTTHNIAYIKIYTNDNPIDKLVKLVKAL